MRHLNLKLTLLGALALVAAPLAYAHDPAGTYKNYCEPVGEWNVHEYGPPATGVLLQGYEDGNLGGDCDGSGLGFEPGTPCAGFEDPADPLTFYVGLCDSQLDLPAADYDGHAEYARGGAWLLVESGSGEPSSDPSVGAGTLYCFGDEGHHPAFGPFGVQDAALGAGAAFSVYADREDLTGVGEGCGDFESDFGSDCVGGCTVTFGPGLDGSYQVYVAGTQGHVFDGGIPTDPTLVGPTAGGPVLTSTFGAAPTVTVPPGWDCAQTTPWTGGESGSGTIELFCTAEQPNLGLCQKPIVSVYLYSGTGSITGSTGCTSLDASCTASLPLSGNPTVASCTAQSNQTWITGVLCRIDVAAGQPYFAWSANCSNDP